MLKFWYDATMLSLESQRVVGLRMMTLAGGGKNAQAEASRMVTEKFAASMAAAVTLMCGGSGEAVLAQVRKKVRSNSRRLSR
jgi:predicted oxidoreductase